MLQFFCSSTNFGLQIVSLFLF